MYLPSVHEALGGVAPADAYPYAPPSGRPALRDAWRQKLLAENPSPSWQHDAFPDCNTVSSSA